MGRVSQIAEDVMDPEGAISLSELIYKLLVAL